MQVRFRDALEDAGFRLRGGGGYELQFRVSGVSPQGRSGSSLNLSGDGGSGPSGTVDLKMRWKAETDKAAAPRRSRQISVLVTDADRNEVWRAHIRLQSASGGDLTLAHAMVPALIAHLGRTVFALRVP